MEDEVISLYARKNPAYAKKQRLGLWTGDTPRHIYQVERVRGGIKVPTYYAEQVVGAVCSQTGCEVDVVDERVLGEDLPGLPWDRIRSEMYDYQRDAVEALSAQGHGMVSSPTGSGKTKMIAGLIAKEGKSALVMVHTKELMSQTVAALEKDLGTKVGTIGGGKKNDVRLVTVGMVQTLARMDDDDDVFRAFTMLIQDEVHLAPAATFVDVAHKFFSYNKYGFTATAFRKDGMFFVTQGTYGPVVYTVPPDKVIDAGRIVYPDVVPVESSFDMAGEYTWAELLDEISNDRRRNQLVADLAYDQAVDGHPTVIMVDRIDHAENLHSLLEESSINHALLHGKLKKSVLDLEWEKVRSGCPLTVATMSLVGTGIDVKPWSRLVLASPVMGGPKFMQVMGRIARASKGKKDAVLYDIVDVKLKQMRIGHSQRMKLWRNKGQRQERPSIV